MKRFIFAVLFFSSITIAGYAEEITLTFNEAVAIGLRDNRTIIFSNWLRIPYKYNWALHITISRYKNYLIKIL